MLRDVDMYSFWVLMMVVWNAPCGPLSDRTRWQQLLESWQSMFSCCTAKTCPLFQELADAILQERGGYASLDLPAGASGVDEVLWDALSRDPPFCVGMPKVNLNRFFSSTQRAAQELKKWHTSLLNFQYLALEEDMLGTKGIQKVCIKVPPQENDELLRQSTDARRPTLCDKALRTAANNAIVVGVAMLGEVDHYQYVKIILEAGGPTEAWHRAQAHTLRSAVASKDWLLSQLEGAFVAHLVETLGKWATVAVLQHIGIACDGLGAMDLSGVSMVEVVREDDLSALLADACMSMVGRRMARTSWAFGGWPGALAGLLGSQELRSKTVAAFKCDYMAYKSCAERPNPSQHLKKILARSIFLHSSNLQVALAFDELGWSEHVHPEIIRMMEQRCSGIISSQASEDCFNVCKNSHMVKGKKQYRRPEKCYSIMLGRKVADKIHKYSPVDIDVALDSRSVQIHRDVFYPDEVACSLPVKDLVSTKQQPPWHTTTAADMGRVFADLQVLRDIANGALADSLEALWLSRLCSSRHKLLLKHALKDE
eukprot:12741060-Alexandrium_andersonii.AAC.1